MKLMKSSFLLVLLSVTCSLFSNDRPIVTIGIPKCGNHLLVKLLRLLMDKENIGYGQSLSPEKLDQDVILGGQLLPGLYHKELLQKRNCRVFFIYRDPRDQTISRAYWIRKREKTHYPSVMIDCSLSSTMNMLMYNNFCNAVTTRDYYERMLPWVACSFVYVTTFEKLVGSKGGGSDEIQMQEVLNIIAHLDIECSQEKIKNVIDNLFGPTMTFRKGLIGEWKNEFTDEQRELFKQTTGQLLIDLGYEKDFNW